MIEIISRKSDSCKFCKENERSKIKNVKIIYEYEDPKAYGFPEPAHWSEEIDTFFCPMCGRVVNGSRMAEVLKDPNVKRILSERGVLQSNENS
ncbi:MAG: hypothetical protein K6C68_13025 [Ruminococcus sp.]|nr:hypothetical protein [Ruminococcus sp.]